MKKLHVTEIVGPNRRGRPLMRQKGRVKEYMCERGTTRGEGLDLTWGSVWIGKDGGSFAMATSLGDVAGGS